MKAVATHLKIIIIRHPAETKKRRGEEMNKIGMVIPHPSYSGQKIGTILVYRDN